MLENATLILSLRFSVFKNLLIYVQTLTIYLLQRTANEYAEERRIHKDLISKKNNVDILNSASRILQC